MGAKILNCDKQPEREFFFFSSRERHLATSRVVHYLERDQFVSRLRHKQVARKLKYRRKMFYHIHLDIVVVALS